MLKIMLDPGHGGGRAHNRGFVQVDNLPYCNEGDCNFIYAKDYLKPALEAYGFVVGLTKDTIDPDPSLQSRGAKGEGYDLLISCHSNAANGQARGVEIWDSTNPAESIRPLCEKITSAVAQTLKTPNRGVKYRTNNRGSNYYGILRYGLAKHNFIIEHVFHDNIEDATVYRKNLQKTANAVADAIAGYYGASAAKSPSAPVPVETREEQFITSLVSHLSAANLNLLPSVTIAQAILESNWGRSELAKEANNLFGIKASPDWTGEVYRKSTKEQKPTGEVYSIQADFRKYQNTGESIEDHDQFFISTEWRKKNYAPVLEAKDYKTQAYALQTCGYATDRQYGQKLVTLIERLGLQQFDGGLDQYMKRDTNGPSEWAKEAWDWATKEGITDGSDPKRTCTREEVIVMIDRALKLKKG